MLETSASQAHAHENYGAHRPDYTVRVRGTTYLWGSAGINEAVNFSSALVLHVGNDKFGETITVGTEKPNGTKTTLGTLEAGEHFSIPVQSISGVFASCTLESTVACRIRRAA